MIHARRTLLACALALAVASPALAQTDENAMFGGGDVDAGTPAAAPVDGGSELQLFGAEASDAGEQEREENAAFGANGNGQVMAPASEVAPQNPLTIGGDLYLRAQTSAYSDQPAKNWGWDSPNLLDVYLDARPNSRVRALAVGRLTYDPTIDPTVIQLNGVPSSQINTYLDQLWIGFDIGHTVFVTVGKQHVKWGTGHIWNPTDFLQPVKLNPLDILDQRLGVSLIKAHIPWEAKGWNFYGYGVFQGSQIINTLYGIGGAARAEIVLGPAELGFDTLLQHGRKPRFGADLSSGLGPFDVYAEVALHGPDGPAVVLGPNGGAGVVPGTFGLASYQLVTGVQPQASAGGTWQVNLNDRDALTIGLEGFYNASGYTDPHVYPALILTGTYTPFYVGKAYAALYATASLPRGQTVNTFSFTTFGNMSDQSYISRLDYNVNLLVHLSLDLYGDVHYGTDGGEFRFGFNTATISGGSGQIPQEVVPTPLFDVGVALRVNL